MLMYDLNLLNDLKTKKQQVEYILENYKISRDNDFALQWYWLRYFGLPEVKLPWIDFENIKDLSGSLESVRRVRQKIQNEEERLLPLDPEVIAKRRKREKSFRRVIYDV